MGACCYSSQYLSDHLTYHSNLTISIKEKNTQGKTITFDSINFNLPPPYTQTSDTFESLSTKFKLTSCVLPATDPRNLIKKDCQDGFCFSFIENFLFICLFDGHGKEGASVVKFCEFFLKTYFNQNFQDFQLNTQGALFQSMVSCDEELRKSSEIDSSLSGCTALAVVVSDSKVVVSNIGDSRAVLGTIPIEEKPEKVLLKGNKYIRMIEPIRKLGSFALSAEQKPVYQSEYERIMSSGGVVQQLSDSYGNRIGPFRVFEKESEYPGLAMSRSIGDEIGKKIGITAEPLLNSFDLHRFRDLFIVIASDGVWDVISNIESVNFIERYRKKCEIESSFEYPGTIKNCSVARLLCEEARYRWLGICEEEDVIIDDISCVVVEILPKSVVPLSLPVYCKRNAIETPPVVDVKQSRSVKAGVIRGDLIRGSFVPSC